MLTVDSLDHSFGPNPVLEDVSLVLKKGEVVSVVGPSGCGKSTLLHLCGGLIKHTSGRIENTFSRTAFAFQDARLLPWKTTLDNIAFGLKACGVDKQIRHQKAAEIARQFGLDEEDLLKYPKELSGGMRQRVSFARAMLTQPELLFLDEPFSALDIGIKRELQKILQHKIVTENLTILFVTHDLMEAVRLSDRILLLDGDPSVIVEAFPIDTPLEERDDEFVYQMTARMLSEPHIMNSFELFTA